MEGEEQVLEGRGGHVEIGWQSRAGHQLFLNSCFRASLPVHAPKEGWSAETAVPTLYTLPTFKTARKCWPLALLVMEREETSVEGHPKAGDTVSCVASHLELVSSVHCPPLSWAWLPASQIAQLLGGKNRG